MEILQILLTLILAIYAAISAKKWKEISKAKKIFVIIPIIAALLSPQGVLPELRIVRHLRG